jgi:hypothetical protein
MISTSNDFSGEMNSTRGIRWRLWLVVLALHLLAASGLNAALGLNRLTTTHSASSIDVAILPPEVPVPEVMPAPKVEAKKIAIAQPLSKSEPISVPAVTPEIATTPALDPVALSETVVAAATATTAESPTPHGLRAITPDAVMLKYNVIKDRDSAKASLAWRVDKSSGADAAPRYELTYEASYFGVSLIKQVSAGTLGAAGLLPTRFSDKRRGKSEQAAHFDRDKRVVTFSNNRPETKLSAGSQDRASVLIQLASLAAAHPRRFKAGDILELPVASVDELEPWSFEVQASERLALPMGNVPAFRLLRRPRRSFDQTIEVWLAPSLAYLPVRIRYTDSAGVTDSLLASLEKL